MLQNTLISLFERDLLQLKLEIESYSKEENLWKTNKSITNSAGNLCLHLIGNLNWFIGAQLGNTGYIRKRDLEFSSKNITKSVLLLEIKNTLEIVKNTIKNIPPDEWGKPYPIDVFKQNSTNTYFLIHLSTHLAYHLGQINYHRRLLD